MTVGQNPRFFQPAMSAVTVSCGTPSTAFLGSNQPDMWFNVMIYCSSKLQLQPLDVDMLWAIEKNSRRQAWIVENKAVPVTKEDYFKKKMGHINAVLNFIKNNPKQVEFHILGSRNPNNRKEIFRRVAKANNEESALHQEMLDIFSGDVSVTFRIALDCTQQQNLQLCQKIEDAQSIILPKERAFSKVRLHAARGPSAIEGNQHQLSDLIQPRENTSDTQGKLREQFMKKRFGYSKECYPAFSANNICEIPSVSVMSILPTHQQVLFSKVVVQGNGAIIKLIDSGKITLPNGWKFLKISKKGNNKSQAALVVKVEQGSPLESFEVIRQFSDYHQNQLTNSPSQFS